MTAADGQAALAAAQLKVILVGFAQAEELSEHTASMPAVLHFLQGEATVLGQDGTRDSSPSRPA